MLYSLSKHFPCATEAGIDIRVTRGITYSAHCMTGTALDSSVPPRDPLNYALTVLFFTGTEVSWPQDHTGSKW